ncbi:hypothetical protein [uncultured Brevundimonas sp.]|uniref:tyrosine phosphatase family protein n=1 Tax=uncultured Brevundimonas sp. TaxID=213418 RepID=UPI00262E8ACB|nr:hypothetical protein [uncultured Brevundimonas sp.]
MSIIVCPLHDVEAIARVRRPSHILSLISPSAEPTGFQCLAPYHLELRFNDIAEPRDGLIEPSAEHIQSIIEFGRSSREQGPLLIHCWAGVSRSPAAAFIIGFDRDRPAPTHLAARLRSSAPYCTPNPRMIALADAALDAQGDLFRAIKEIGRGKETCWGTAFEISKLV